VIRKLCIAFILTLGLLWTPPRALAADPPTNLAKLVAANEAVNAEARENYTYRQSIQVNDFNRTGKRGGLYEEIRDVTFSPDGGRAEEFLKGPFNTLKYLKMTEEDFLDIRDVQPFLFTTDQLWIYETRYRGIDIIDGVEYYALEVKPRQVFHGLRYFEGMFWIDTVDLSVARSEGRAVPSIVKSDSENIFPHFTTIRQKVDDKYWFPTHTDVDDVLPFRTGPVRIRMTIKYSNYRRFAAESTIQFEQGPQP
jgi:hypothetical protein